MVKWPAVCGLKHIPILLATVFTLQTPCIDSARSADNLAVVIGNNGYQHVLPLANAANDARLFAKTLSEAGFEIVGGVHTDLDRGGMWKAVDELKQRMNKDSNVVFYYAGHGVQINNNPMLLGIDIEDHSEDQVAHDAINLFDVQEELQSAHFALLVIDACRNNPFPPRAGRTRAIGSTTGLLAIEPAAGSAIILSASRGQTALDIVPGVTANNGLFTYELVRAIRQPDVDVLDALRQVRDQVEDDAKRADHIQRPALVEEMRGRFILFPSGRLPPAQAASQPRAAAACPGELSHTSLDAALNTGIRAQVNLTIYPEGTGKYAAASATLPKVIECLQLLQDSGISTADSRQFLRQARSSAK